MTAAHLYDAVKIYAKAISVILREGGNVRNGTLVLQKILNQTYHSIQGFDVSEFPSQFQMWKIIFFFTLFARAHARIFSLQVYIDESGDAEGNYSVVSVVNHSSENGTTHMKMQPVGYFQYETNKTHNLPVSFGDLYFRRHDV